MSEDTNRRQNRNESRREARREEPRETRQEDRPENRREEREGPATRRPSHIAFQVRNGEDGKSYFNRIGSAFPHKDGEGYNVLLDAFPTDGKVTLRTPQERLEDQRSNGNRRSGNARGRDEGPSYER